MSSQTAHARGAQRWLAVEPRALPAQIADDMQRRILDGEFDGKPRLPSERSLVEQYGVSRAVVREAVKLLSERGLVYAHPGRGTFIAEPDFSSFERSISLAMSRMNAVLSDVLEARRMIEMEVVTLAALRRTEEDLDNLEDAVEAMKLAIGSSTAYIQADHRFHRCLASASKNDVLILLVDGIADPVQESRHLMYHVKDAPARGVEQHGMIVTAVRAQDVGGARDAMATHLEEVAHATALVANTRGGNAARKRWRASS